MYNVLQMFDLLAELSSQSFLYFMLYLITNVMVVLSSSGLEFLLVKYTSTYENSELKVLKNKKLLGGISSNWPNNLINKNVYKTLKLRQ